MSTAHYPRFASRDLDGFFGLFVDNLVQLLLIVGLSSLCGITPESPLLVNYMLPGAAISVLLGNLFYAWQARKLAAAEGRSDVTALPYGINTPSLLVYYFFVMIPVFAGSKEELGDAAAAKLAWQAGLLACLGSGVIELAGAFVGDWLRRNTPRAALLSTLAGVAIGFISMTFALQIFQRPVVAMLPLAIILLTYFAGVRFPWRLPGGLVAVILGTACAWILPNVLPASVAGPTMDTSAIAAAANLTGLHPPRLAITEVFPLLADPSRWIGYLSVIIPMGVFNVIGSLQNLESAEAAGDRYRTKSSLAANGIGTIVAACFGSCFPTTIYIGHPGWKGLGARAGYSTLNGIVITLICLTGTVSLISRLIPIEAGVAIVVWIGIIITSQAFSSIPKEHIPAAATGLFPAIAAWGATIVPGAFFVSGGETIQTIVTANQATEVNGFLIHGMIVLERGFIFTCMILSAISAFLIDRRFGAAAIWSLAAAALAFVGLTHAYTVTGNVVDFHFVGTVAPEGSATFSGAGVGVGYLMFAAAFGVTGWLTRNAPNTSD